MSKDLLEQFKNLASSSIEDQTEFFLKSFIFALEDNWKDVVNLAKSFRKYLKDANEGREDLNPIQASDFLQKNGLERTALQRKEELADIDIDKNDRIAFVEYLLLHYKVMVLQEYYKRTGEECKENLSKGGIGVTGVGAKLLEELFTFPTGLSPELAAAIEEFTKTKKAKEQKMKDLSAKAAQGGVKGKAAENEIKQMEQEDSTSMNKLEITLNAAKKKASKSSADVALQEKKQKEEAEAKAKKDAGRNKIKGIANQWETK